MNEGVGIGVIGIILTIALHFKLKHDHKKRLDKEPIKIENCRLDTTYTKR